MLDQGVCVQFVYGQIVCVCRLCGSAGWVCVRLWVCVCVCGKHVYIGTRGIYGDMLCLWGHGVFMGKWGVYGDMGCSWGH